MPYSMKLLQNSSFFFDLCLFVKVFKVTVLFNIKLNFHDFLKQNIIDFMYIL